MQLADAFRRTNVKASEADMAALGFTGKSYAGFVNFNMSVKNHPNYAAALDLAKKEVSDHQSALSITNPTKQQTARFVRVRMRELLLDGFEHNGVKHKGLGLSEFQKESANSIAKSQIFTEQRNGIGSMAARGINKLKSSNAALDFVLSPLIPFTTIIGNMTDTMLDYDPIGGMARTHNFSVSSLIRYAAGSGKDGKRIGSSSMAVDPKVDWLGFRMEDGIKDQRYYEQIGRNWTGIHTLIGLSLMVNSNPYGPGLGVTWDPDDDKRTIDGDEYSVFWNGEKLFSYKELPIVSVPLSFVGAFMSHKRNPERFGGKSEFGSRLAYAWWASQTMPLKMSVGEGAANAMDLLSNTFNMASNPSMTSGEKIYEVLLKPYLKTTTKALPWRYSLAEQVTSLIMGTEKYSTSSYSQSLEYFFEGAAYGRISDQYKAVDIFGEEIKMSPIKEAIPFLDYFTKDVAERPYRKFLHERDISLGNAQNRAVARFDDEAILGVEYRDYTPEEWDYFSREAGKTFKENIEELMKRDDIAEMDKTPVIYGGKTVSMTEKVVRQLLAGSRLHARNMVIEKFDKPDAPAYNVESIPAYEGGNQVEGTMYNDIGGFFQKF